MNCPYCGNEMEAGYLQGQSMILWDTELQDGIVNLSDRGAKKFRFDFPTTCAAENLPRAQLMQAPRADQPKGDGARVSK